MPFRKFVSRRRPVASSGVHLSSCAHTQGGGGFCRGEDATEGKDKELEGRKICDIGLVSRNTRYSSSCFPSLSREVGFKERARGLARRKGLRFVIGATSAVCGVALMFAPLDVGEAFSPHPLRVSLFVSRPRSRRRRRRRLSPLFFFV